MSIGQFTVESLRNEAINSRAVKHPYLDALVNGQLPNTPLALLDLSRCYAAYSSHFVKYLGAVIAQLENPEHRNELTHNLREEHGEVDDLDLGAELKARIDGVPHTQLFQWFQSALEQELAQSSQLPASDIGESWRESFFELCQQGACAGIGALGIATELIVPHIYERILLAIQNHTSLSPEQYVFFTLHAGCDEAHANVLLEIARDLVVDTDSADALGQGVRAAIDMRISFWDQMYERALKMPAGLSLVQGQPLELEA